MASEAKAHFTSHVYVVYLYECMCVYWWACLCMYLWRPEIGLRHLPLYLFKIFYFTLCTCASECTYVHYTYVKSKRDCLIPWIWSCGQSGAS